MPKISPLGQKLWPTGREQTHTHTDRQTDRQTDGQTGRQTARQIDLGLLSQQQEGGKGSRKNTREETRLRDG